MKDNSGVIQMNQQGILFDAQQTGGQVASDFLLTLQHNHITAKHTTLNKNILKNMDRPEAKLHLWVSINKFKNKQTNKNSSSIQSFTVFFSFQCRQTEMSFNIKASSFGLVHTLSSSVSS